MSEPLLRDFVAGRDEPAIAALWERCFGRASGGQTVEWLFRDGPAGPCPRSVAELDGRVVAHAGVSVSRFRVSGREGLGGYSVGAMTDPDARGRGLFVRTAEHLYARLAREGFAFVAGFSNANSERIHTGPLGRTPIRPFPWCVRLVRPASAGMAILRGLSGGAAPAIPPAPALAVEAPGLRVEPCAVDDPRIDAVWSRAKSDVEIGAIRDARYAQWRYGSRPDAGYQAFLALRGSEPTAWAVGRMLPLRGLRAGFLLELLASPTDPAAGEAALGALEAWFGSRGGQLVSALRPGCGVVRDVLSRRRYLPIPERLHPQTIRYSVKGFGPFEGNARLGSPAAWWLSWGDTDVV